MHTSTIAHYRAAEQRLFDHYGLTPTEHFVRLPALETSVRVVEVGQGEPVLFVHGSPNAGLKWVPLAAQLPDFRCLLLDRPGCGLSEPVDYRRLDLRTFGVDLLGQTLDGLGLPRAALVASSLGGALAFYFTHAHPQRVVRLVQEGCPAFPQGFRVPLYNIVGDLPSWYTVYQQTQRWLKAGAFEELVHDLRMLLREIAAQECVPDEGKTQGLCTDFGPYCIMRTRHDNTASHALD
jgi:pimeloyl-ACP methyl ester carboxylesterase